MQEKLLDDQELATVIGGIDYDPDNDPVIEKTEPDFDKALLVPPPR